MKLSASKIKLKYKLLLISLLPFFAMLVLVGFMIMDDMENYRKSKVDKDIISIINAGSHLSSALINELSLSIDHIREKSLSENFETTMKISRENRAHSIEEFKTFVHEAEPKFQKFQLDTLLYPLEKALNDIESFQYKVDRKTVGIKEVSGFFEEIRSKLITTLGKIKEEIHHPMLLRPMLNFLILLNEQAAAVHERSLFMINAANAEFSTAAFAVLNQEGGKQMAFRDIYYLFGSNREDKLRNDMMQNSSFQNALRIRNNYLTSPTASIDLNDLWDAQSEKIVLYNSIQEEIADDTMEKAEEIRSQLLQHIIMLVSFSIISIVIAFFIMYLSLKKMVERLQKEVDILASTGEKIMSSLTEASVGTSETASSVAETTSTVEELKQTAELASQSAKDVADVSQCNLKTLTEVEKNLSQNMDGMNNIKNGMQTISQSIVQLSENTLTIKNIIDTVDDLAEQSHLLAINAAIEAAKAKEHGKGFSVVAQEIRNLAEQSKQATVQVRKILNDIKNSTSGAVMATEQGTKAVNFGVEFSGTMNETVKSLSENIVNAADATNQITQNSEQQLVGVSQVTNTMVSIKEASAQHAEQIQQIESALQGVNDTANNLRALIFELKM